MTKDVTATSNAVEPKIELSKGEHWLMCVAGSTPSVITETLYCLKDRAHFPNTLVIFTTLHGKAQIEKWALAEHIKQLCVDYNLPVITPEQMIVKIVTDAKGEYLEDIRCSADQEAMADFLTHEIRSITHPKDNKQKRPDTIHASLAGGRKSMSFYMGNIFSFFANSQDELSHVLVDSNYEVPGFWYPTPYSKMISIKIGQSDNYREIDAKDAVLELSTIPFVRLNHALVNAESALFHQLNYRQLVDIYQVTLDPSLINLTFDLKNMKVFLNDRELLINSFDSYLFYYLIAFNKKYHGVQYVKEPVEHHDGNLTKDFFKLMGRVVGCDHFMDELTEIDKLKYFEFIDRYLLKFNNSLGRVRSMHSNYKLFESMCAANAKNGSKKDTISEKSFERMMTDIRKSLEQTEGKVTVERCKVMMLKETQGQFVPSKGRGAYLGLLLSADQIHFIN